MKEYLKNTNYNKIEYNFDLLLHYQEELGLTSYKLSNLSDDKKLSQVKKLHEKVNVLKEVSVIFSEDTRVTGLLLKHLDISKWDLEKNASMRFIARCYKNKQNMELTLQQTMHQILEYILQIHQSK